MGSAQRVQGSESALYNTGPMAGVTLHLSQPPEHTTPKANELKANEGQRMKTTSQCRVILITNVRLW